MKTKTVRKIIKKKMADWLTSIEDDEVRNIARRNAFVTGGCIASMLLREDVNDFDVYFKTKEATLAVMDYYNKKAEMKADILDGSNKQKLLDEFADVPELSDEAAEARSVYHAALLGLTPDRVRFYWYKGIYAYKPVGDGKGGVVDPGKYHVEFCSPNAISLSDDVQLVVRFYGEPSVVHENYDFVHATNYYDVLEDRLILNQPALEALLTRTLVYIGSKYPITSIIRTKKFLKRGFTCSAGEYLKMSYQVSKLDLNDPIVLNDQLVGVDIAYFSMIINIIDAKYKKNPEFEFSYDWLKEIIDRVFNDESEDSEGFEEDTISELI